MNEGDRKMGCGGGGMGHRMHHGGESREHNAAGPDPLTLLKERLARGDITLEEYQKLRQVLSEDAPAILPGGGGPNAAGGHH